MSHFGEIAKKIINLINSRPQSPREDEIMTILENEYSAEPNSQAALFRTIHDCPARPKEADAAFAGLGKRIPDYVKSGLSHPRFDYDTYQCLHCMAVVTREVAFNSVEDNERAIYGIPSIVKWR